MEKESGYLLARVNEVNHVGAFFSSSVAQMLVSILEFAGILAILLYMNWYLTLICLIPLPILFILLSRWSRGGHATIQGANGGGS
jgi:ATP-binding cassette subfamily B protein